MLAIRTKFDGEEILLADDLRGLPPQEVIVIYEAQDNAVEAEAWLKAQGSSSDKAWDNDEDTVYDQQGSYHGKTLRS